MSITRGCNGIWTQWFVLLWIYFIPMWRVWRMNRPMLGVKAPMLGGIVDLTWFHCHKLIRGELSQAYDLVNVYRTCIRVGILILVYICNWVCGMSPQHQRQLSVSFSPSNCLSDGQLYPHLFSVWTSFFAGTTTTIASSASIGSAQT